MKDILYFGKLNKGIKKVSHLNAELHELKEKIRKTEKEEINLFYAEMDSETFYQIVELIEKHGIRYDKDNIKKIKEKYENKKLRHDDLVVLESLYKSNAKYFSRGEKDG